MSPWWCTYSNGTRPKGQSTELHSLDSCDITTGEDRQDCFSSDPEISFVPMIFGIPGHGIHGNDTSPDPHPRYKVGLFWSSSLRLIFGTNNVQEILGFNEPDQEGHQSDIPPGEAALAWIELQEKFPDQVRGGGCIMSFRPGPCGAWCEQHHERMV